MCDFVNEKPFHQKGIAKFSKKVLKGKFFGFVQVDIEVPDELYDKVSEMVPLFVVQERPNCNITEEIKRCKDQTGRKTVKGTKKLLGLKKAKKDVFVHVYVLLVSATWFETYISLPIG